MGTYIDEVCVRCGSKKIISKTWKETLETFAGTSELEISQIVCTNKKCQEQFEISLAQDMKKREEAKEKKAVEDQTRKDNIVKMRQKKKEVAA